MPVLLVRGPHFKNLCLKEKQKKYIGPDPTGGAEGAERCNHDLFTPESLRKTGPQADDYNAS